MVRKGLSVHDSVRRLTRDHAELPIKAVTGWLEAADILGVCVWLWRIVAQVAAITVQMETIDIYDGPRSSPPSSSFPPTARSCRQLNRPATRTRGGRATGKAGRTRWISGHFRGIFHFPDSGAIVSIFFATSFFSQTSTTNEAAPWCCHAGHRPREICLEGQADGISMYDSFRVASLFTHRCPRGSCS